MPADTRLLVVVRGGHIYYSDRSYLRADPYLSGIVDWQSMKNVEEFHELLTTLKVNYIFYDKQDWATYPGGANMMQLIEKLKSVNLAKTLWTHQVPLYSSRILEKFDLNLVELIKVD